MCGDQQNALPALKKAWSLAKTQQYHDAIRVLESLNRALSSSEHASLAHFYYMIDDHPAAELHAGKSLTLSVKNRLALTTLGEIRFKQGNIEDAASCFLDAMKFHPLDHYVALRSAQILMSLEKYADAVSVLEKMREHHTNDLEVLKLIQVAYAYSGRIQDADTIRDLIDDVSGDLGTNQADKLISGLNKMEPEHAIRQLKIIMDSTSFKSNFHMHEFAADLYIREGRFQEASEHLEVLLRKRPRSPGVKLKLARCYARTKRFRDALTILDSLEYMMSDEYYLVTRIEVLVLGGHLQEAIDLAVSTLLNYPRNRQIREWVTKLQRKGVKPSSGILEENT
jgi:predicted Zn-dependent protease